MKWNLRMAAAKREIWKASVLQRALAERGLVLSAGKMSGLWSGQPASLKLDELDVICAVLGCEIGELLIPEPEKLAPGPETENLAPAAGMGGPGTTPLAIVPRRTGGRSLPPPVA